MDAAQGIVAQEQAEVNQAFSEAEAAKSQTETEAGPSKPIKEKSLETRKEETEKETAEQIQSEKTTIPTPEASCQVFDYIVGHASGKRLCCERACS